MGKKRYTLYLSRPLARKFDLIAQQSNGAKSALVEEALRASLEPRQHDGIEEGLARRLNELHKTVARQASELHVATETLALFVRYYLTVSTPLPEAHLGFPLGPEDLLVEPDGTEPLAEGGMALGLFPQVRFKRGVRQLEPGEVLVACTDGIVEASDALEQQYGSERLAAVVRGKLGGSAQEIVDAIFADVDRHAEGGGRHDDDLAARLLLGVRDRRRDRVPIFEGEGLYWHGSYHPPEAPPPPKLPPPPEKPPPPLPPPLQPPLRSPPLSQVGPGTIIGPVVPLRPEGKA